MNMEVMTVEKALNHAGIIVKEEDCSTWSGTTPKGKKFLLSHAGGAYGLQFTLEIEGMNRITHCLYRTAVRKIKQS